MIYCIFINILSFIVYGVDKYKAIHQKYRIPENILLCLTILGGGIGSLCAMFVFRHKIRKRKFYIGIPILLVIQYTLYVKYFT
ncbi:DUF1294 domain-containing protein [Floccifex sp.]|uniref:DUF1294 domain-containing protein n=1 Tax=Floccifex sp. TaxID=2815810 RepID=UPI003F09B479